MIELLSSSKFTAGTWEQFVCCLPNMTQEIITDIKQGEETSPSQYMSAVAQHFIDNNPDITWRGIIDALLDQNPDLTWKTITISLLHAEKTLTKKS